MISVRHLHKSFGDKPVLIDASVDVYDGETLAIIGHSGSGKSVLMKHMIGLLKPDRGRVLVDDIDLNEISYDELRQIRKSFGVLFQGGALFDSMTAYDNVAFPLRTFSDFSDPEIGDRVMYCLERVHLADIGKKQPSELSGGMRKRVALARAIALEPKYILYDEPTSGLDPQTATAINQLIRQLADDLAVTSVIITHDMRTVLTVGDRCVFLYDGSARWTGTTDELHNADDEVLLSFVRANEYHIGPSPLIS